MPDRMINVGIVGSLAAIERHANALTRIQDIRITGRWITDGEQGSATDAETGVTCMSPSQVTGNADALIIAAGGTFADRWPYPHSGQPGMYSFILLSSNRWPKPPSSSSWPVRPMSF